MSMELSDIIALKEALLSQLKQERGVEVYADVVLGVPEDFPKARDFAYTDGAYIYFSPKILSALTHRVDGLLRHELAHVILMQKGLFSHSERDADRVAAWAFGTPILYDSEDIQSTLEGRPVRPSYLPKQ
jgi:hypothetical protein